MLLNNCILMLRLVNSLHNIWNLIFLESGGSTKNLEEIHKEMFGDEDAMLKTLF